ncbi:hypothetical protein [Marinobacterium lacunae]|uniref:hypothetical protein n=1 Tax=Marinobacterium lacunae TaxID=1232683 RepID=UPI00056B7BFB|nr:hypothetical protein [Marinobacterium lacunae]
MKEWLREVEESLIEALEVTKSDSVPLHNMYMLAPIIYSRRKRTNNASLIQEMIDANDDQVTSEWSLDEKSKDQYKFHYVSSYIYCFVIAGKIDEFKYDQIMECINERMDLFEDD